jgi:dienelactone hydrolase
MADETYTSAGQPYTITIYPGPADGKRHPMIIVVHGNIGLRDPFGEQIHRVAHDLAAEGYVTAVPRYYRTDPVEPTDQNAPAHVPTLADAIAKVAARADADPARLGLFGYSLGAATSMTYIATRPPGTVQVLVDFYGPLNATIEAGIAKFPPTFIRHNKDDQFVSVEDSKKLKGLLGSIPCDFDTYTENNLLQGHHPFIKGGTADKDSRQKARDWIVLHLPPGGR